MFKRGKRAYVYIKTFSKQENGKKLKYVGAAQAEKLWHDETELCQSLREHGYFTIPFSHIVHPGKKKSVSKPVQPPPTANPESEEEWVGYKMEEGDPQAIRDRYWDTREFLEACPNDEETAREIYGDEEVDIVLEREDSDDKDDDSKDE